MMCIAPYHFLHSLISMGLLYEDDSVTATDNFDPKKLLERVRFHAESNLDIWLRKSWCTSYRKVRRFRPSIVAIACVLAARKVIGVMPILSERLKEMALLEECYTEEDGVFEEIGECYEHICAMQGVRKKLNANKI